MRPPGEKRFEFIICMFGLSSLYWCAVALDVPITIGIDGATPTILLMLARLEVVKEETRRAMIADTQAGHYAPTPLRTLARLPDKLAPLAAKPCGNRLPRSRGPATCFLACRTRS